MRNISRKKTVIILTASLIVIAAAIAAFTAVHAKADDDKNVVTEDVKVSTVDITNTLTAAGEIVTAKEETIDFSTSKVFKAMCVEENEKVEKGQHLIMYSDGTYEDAPAAGFVTAINAPATGSCGDSSNYVTFAYEKKLRIDITVPESEINDIAVGDTCEVTLGSDETKQYKGKIVSIKAISTTQLGSEETEESGVPGGQKEGSGSSPFGSDSSTAYYTVSLTIKNDGTLLPGMSAISTVVKSEEKEVTAVPVEAVRYDDEDKAYVVVVNGKETENVYVETGVSDAEYVEIKDGLSGDETVRIERKEYA